MPYILRKQKTRGYKVCKRGTRKCFSKRPLTKRMAKRQMRALYLHERVGGGGGARLRKSRNKRCIKGGMFHKGAAATTEAATTAVHEEDPAIKAAVVQMPIAYAQFLRVSKNGRVDGEGNPLTPTRFDEIQETLAYPTPELPPHPKYELSWNTSKGPSQHELEQQTFGCPSGDFIRFKRQMRFDDKNNEHITVKNYHKLQMSLLEHLCSVYDPTTLEGIQSIQNIGVRWKQFNPPD
jgi:hypothetical protein